MTAVGVAYLRALESTRSDRLFNDPLARAFVEASGWAPPDGTERDLEDTSDEIKAFWGTVARTAIVRTRFLDDYVAEAAARGIRQLAILGAGLDARAFRLSWPQRMRIFELDVPEVMDFKERVIASTGSLPAAERIVVRSDLREDWLAEQQRGGFDTAAPSAWIAEGLLIYLTAEENERLLATITAASAQGSRLALTLGGPGSLDVPSEDAENIEQPLVSYASVNAMWKSEAPEDPAAWLAHHGWVAEVFGARERAAAYGRPLPENAPSAATRAFVTATRV